MAMKKRGSMSKIDSWESMVTVNIFPKHVKNINNIPKPAFLGFCITKEK